MSTDLSALRPYKGPIPFVEEDSGRFFGRETDIENLRGMLRTERILLLHSPSGAGKTSLLQAGLIPRMRQDGFRVLPPIRVGHPLPAQASQTPGTNRYAYSVMRSVETALSPSADGAAQGERIEDLADIPLSTYFAHRSALRAPDERLPLVFDQVEEVFTMSPHERSGRLRFFSELGTVLQDKKIWALFAIKEEYVGALDAYSRFLPNHFAARYHLDFLTRSAAEQAVRGPLEHVQAPYEPEVVEAILADLTRTDGQEPADSVPQQGEAQELEDLSDAAVIDPLHLQLVCAQVWSQVQRLNLNKVSMDAVVKIREVVGLSAVDAALMQYYYSRIREVPKSVVLSEREIRDWIEEELIQDGRTRRQTLADPNPDSDLAGLQSYLEDQHILRASLRGDSRWYELAHDRLVFLIRKSNEEWYDKNLSLFERHARKWRQLDEPQDFRALSWWVWRKYATGFWGQSKVPLRSEWEKNYLAYCKNRTWWRSVKILAVVLLVLFFLFNLVLHELLEAQKIEIKARRLQALAMQQRYAYQNHDAALLLGSLAKGFRDQAAKQKIRLGPLLSSAEVDRAVWTALEAYPFSRTLPVEVLGGQPKELMQSTSGANVLVKNNQDWRVVSIDLLENRVGIKEVCQNGLQSFSPRDDQVAVADMERKAIRIIRSSCEEIGVLHSPDNIELKETIPVYSGDGKYLAAFLIDGSLAVYQVEHWERQLVGVIPPGSLSCEDSGGEKVPISAITFKEDLIVVGDEGGGIRIFDLAGGHPVIERCLPSFERGWPFYDWLKTRKRYRTILAASLSNDEPPWLTTVHRGGVDIGGGYILQRSLGGEDPPYLVLPDQKSGQRRGGVQEPRPQSDNPSGEEYLSAYFEPNGHRLVTGGAQGAIMLWDLRNPKFQKKIPLDPFDERRENADTLDGFVVPYQFLQGMTGAAKAVLYATVGRSGSADAARNPTARAVVGLDSGAGLRIWDIGFQFKNYLSEDWTGTDYSYALAFHPWFGLITTSNQGKIWTWHIESAPLKADRGDYAKDLEGEKSSLSIRAMDVKESLMVLGLGDYTAQLLDLANPSSGHKLTGEDGNPAHAKGLWSVKFRPKNAGFGSRFDLATGDNAGKVVFWDLADNPGGGGTTGAVSGSCQFQGRIGTLSFHPGGRWLIAGTAIDADRPKAEPYGQLHLVDMEGSACKFSEDGACSGGPCVAGTLGQRGKPSPNAPTTLARLHGSSFSEDGTKLAVSGDYGMLRWWNFRGDSGFTAGDPGMALDGARGKVNAIEFVPGDEYKIAAVGQDGSLRIWSLAENENANPLALRQARTELHGLAVSQDGRYVAAGDARGRFHLWDLDVNRYICRSVLRNLTWHEWLLAVRDEQEYQVICPNREIPAGIPAGVAIKNNKLPDDKGTERRP